jgi:hypothetical protein
MECNCTVAQHIVSVARVSKVHTIANRNANYAKANRVLLDGKQRFPGSELQCPRAHNFSKHRTRGRRQAVLVERRFEWAHRSCQIECALSRRRFEVVPPRVIAKLVERTRTPRSSNLLDE